MGSKSCRLVHVLEIPIFSALLKHKLRHTLKPLQFCRCLKALWIKYLMCCVTVHAYVLDNNEINQQLMPTRSLRHKEYLSDKIHNTLSFSFLKCQLVPRLWLDHTNMGLKRGVWKNLKNPNTPESSRWRQQPTVGSQRPC